MTSDAGRHVHDPPSLDRLAVQATVHCLTGCGIGEVLGLVIATLLGWHDLPSIALAVVLAFVFGYGLTLRSVLGSGIAIRDGDSRIIEGAQAPTPPRETSRPDVDARADATPPRSARTACRAGVRARPGTA